MFLAGLRPIRGIVLPPKGAGSVTFSNRSGRTAGANIKFRSVRFSDEKALAQILEN